MSKLRLRWIIGLMSIALLGLVGFQWYWVNTLISANEDQFRRDVMQSLREVSRKLEQQEALLAFQEQMRQQQRIQSIMQNKPAVSQDANSNTLYFQWGDSLGESSDFQFSLSIETPQQQVGFPASPSNTDQMKDAVEKMVNKSEMMASVMENFLVPRRRLTNRYNKEQLDSLLDAELSNRGINIPYNYGIVQPQYQRLISLTDPQRQPQIVQSEFRVNLFPNDLFGDTSLLLLEFPGKEQFLLNKIWITMSSSGVLMLIILFCFGYAVHTIVRQKKLSEMKNDFINNMTHELKTPIATIGLAAEAMQDKAIASSENMRDRYLGMIGDENRRLGGQVERVLQMARIDREELKLEKEVLDLHDLIHRAVEKIGLQIEHRGGQIKLALNASGSLIQADETHMLNVLLNLLDNAIKYSEGEPKIMIRTEQLKDQLVLYVNDHGIGMSKEAIRHIFEKFYRVPTGNVHNVKGFGLGLPYVKTIVEEHDGKIDVESVVGKGSNFIIKLPITNGRA